MSIDQIKMDRSVVRVFSLDDEPNDVAFWANKTPAERLAVTEYLRVINYGYDSATARLQRVLKISRLGES